MKPKNWGLYLLLDVITFGLGSGLAVYGMIDDGRHNEEPAGWGAFLVAMGFIIRHWTQVLNQRSDSIDLKSTPAEQGTNTKNMAIVLAIVGVGALFSKVSERAENAVSENYRLQSQIEDLEYKITDLEYYSSRR